MFEFEFTRLIAPDALRTLGVWGLTLLAHSTVLVSVVWLVDRFSRSMRNDLREWLWRSALIGGFVSATLVSLLPTISMAPTVAMTTMMPGTGPTSTILADGAESVSVPPPADALPATSQAALSSARTVSIGLLAAGVIAGGIVVLLAWCNTRRVGGDRIDVTHGDARELFDELLIRSGRRKDSVRFTISDSIRMSGAFGLLRPEVCVPRRSLTELSRDELRAMLAHELAHIARWDPFWTFFSLTTERLCFVQPLFHLARRRLRELAEFQADALAIRWTGDGLALASCLVRVGEWVRHGKPLPTLVGAMAQPSSPLAVRVRNAVDSEQTKAIEPIPRTVRRAVLAASVAVSIVVIAMVTPRVQGVTDAFAVQPVSSPLSLLDRRTESVEIEWIRLNESVEVVRALAAMSELSDEQAARLTNIERRLRALNAERATIFQRYSAIDAEVGKRAPTSAEDAPKPQ